MAGFIKLYGLAEDNPELARQLELVQETLRQGSAELQGQIGKVDKGTKNARALPDNEGRKFLKRITTAGAGGGSTTVEIVHRMGRQVHWRVINALRSGEGSPTFRESANRSNVLKLRTSLSATVEFWVYPK